LSTLLSFFSDLIPTYSFYQKVWKNIAGFFPN
jgi:hypothetical protein